MKPFIVQCKKKSTRENMLYKTFLLSTVVILISAKCIFAKEFKIKTNSHKINTNLQANIQGKSKEISPICGYEITILQLKLCHVWYELMCYFKKKNEFGIYAQTKTLLIATTSF